MGNQLRRAVEEMKKDYIRKLLSEGVYSREERKLYELTLSELETEYRMLIRGKKRCCITCRLEKTLLYSGIE